MELLGAYNYWVYVVIMMIGFYAVIARHNLVKKVIGLGIFQTGIFLLYISMGVVRGGSAPVRGPGTPPDTLFANPLPHVLILTAIVVSLSTMAVALAIIVNIQRRYGTIEADEIHRMDREEAEAPAPSPVSAGAEEVAG